MNVAQLMEAALAKLTVEERRRLEAAIAPEADALLQKAFGREVMLLFSGDRQRANGAATAGRLAA